MQCQYHALLAKVLDGGGEDNTDTDTDAVWDVMIGINEDAVKWPYKGHL